MKAEEIFGIVVRTVGIWELASAAAGVALVFTGIEGLITVFAQGAVGGLLLFAAGPITEAAYHWREPEY